MRAVHVVWVDSSTVNMGWEDVKSYRERIEVDTVESVGFVVDETADHLATPLERNPRRVRDEQVNVQPVLAIPKVAIQSIRDLVGAGVASQGAR